VIVHTDPISVPGWQGAGYIIFDPQTGAGAWKIAGGANGGFFTASDLASTVFGLLFSYKAMLAQVWGATAIAKMLASVANHLALANVLIGIVDIAAKCNSSALGLVIASYTAMSVLFIGSVTLLTLATGPVGGFLAGAVLGVTLGYMRNSLTEGAFCRR